eukprot:scaffold3830_cov324-Prasinococcus_capsulatus_cf.AAC.7
MLHLRLHRQLGTSQGAHEQPPGALLHLLGRLEQSRAVRRLQALLLLDVLRLPQDVGRVAGALQHGHEGGHVSGGDALGRGEAGGEEGARALLLDEGDLHERQQVAAHAQAHARLQALQQRLHLPEARVAVVGAALEAAAQRGQLPRLHSRLRLQHAQVGGAPRLPRVVLVRLRAQQPLRNLRGGLLLQHLLQRQRRPPALHRASAAVALQLLRAGHPGAAPHDEALVDPRLQRHLRLHAAHPRPQRARMSPLHAAPRALLREPLRRYAQVEQVQVAAQHHTLTRAAHLRHQLQRLLHAQAHERRHRMTQHRGGPPLTLLVPRLAPARRARARASNVAAQVPQRCLRHARGRLGVGVVCERVAEQRVLQVHLDVLGRAHPAARHALQHQPLHPEAPLHRQAAAQPRGGGCRRRVVRVAVGGVAGVAAATALQQRGSERPLLLSAGAGGGLEQDEAFAQDVQAQAARAPSHLLVARPGRPRAAPAGSHPPPAWTWRRGRAPRRRETRPPPPPAAPSTGPRDGTPVPAPPAAPAVLAAPVAAPAAAAAVGLAAAPG